MTDYYKATRLDGTDFRTGTVKYEVGKRTRHPFSKRRTKDKPSTYLSVSTVPTDCIGMRWPCRLFRVRGVGKPLGSDMFATKRAFLAVDVVEELPAHQVFGPQGEFIAALIERYRNLTSTERRGLRSQFTVAQAKHTLATRHAASLAVWEVAWAFGRGTAKEVAGGTAESAASALVVRDLIGDTFTQEHYDLLTGPWRRAIGPIHPDDEEIE